ncbi:MAG: NAD(P)H-binding protein [Candidatus Spechtbacteria bacterium]|nr:NAD(P)H-binding protein [Candidatus Spechtbacteria bacterium]
MDNSKKKVLVLGGTGFLGYYVLRALDERNIPTGVMIRRKLDDIDIPTEGYDILLGNILDEASTKEAVSKFKPDVIINLVGIVSEKRADITFERVYVNGTQNIIDAAYGAGVKKIVSVSAMGADENSPQKYFKFKAESEKIIKNSGMDWTIFRPSIMFGWRSGFNSMIAKPARRLLFVPMVDGGYHMIQPVAASTVANAIVEACFGAGDNTAYNVVGPEAITIREATERVREAMKSSKPILGVPFWLLRALRIMNETQISMVTGNYTGDPNGLKKDFKVKDIYFDPMGEYPLF